MSVDLRTLSSASNRTPFVAAGAGVVLLIGLLWAQGLLSSDHNGALRTISNPGLVSIVSWSAALGCGIFLVLVFIVARRLAEDAFRPLDAITADLRRISYERDFAARIVTPSGGRSGAVGAGVNALLEAIQARELALETALEEVRALRDQAEAASKAKSSFLANMSHELRTPLNSIMGYATMLQEESASNTPITQDLDRILRAARHLLSLINDILDLSKIEAGKAQVDYVPVGIRGLVQDVVSSLGPTMTAKRNRFDLRIAPHLDTMTSDATKLRQCLVNLLGNAFKFTEAGVVTLDVKIDRKPSGEMVVFTVADTGIGMNDEQMGHVFEAFVQADASITRKFGGTGLGLAITRRLARLMHGDLTVVSSEGKGSVFTLSVPRQPPVADVAEAPHPHMLSETPSDGRLALVVDDDPAAVDLMGRWLSRLGYVVISANDGVQGFELARSRNPSVIVLDIHMPRRTGWDVLDRLKADAVLCNIPVIIVSVDDDRRRGIGAGASEFLTKPTTQESVASAVQIYSGQVNREILIVDDDPNSGDMVERSAKRAGMSVLRAFNGLEGLEMARKHKPAAVVLDLAMPGLDGFGVLKELSSDPELRDTPVIVVSARTLSSGEFERLSRAGCAFHVKGVASPREITANIVAAVNG